MVNRVVQKRHGRYKLAAHLGQGSALSNGNDIASLNTESRRAMGSEVLVSLLVPVVFGDVVEAVKRYMSVYWLLRFNCLLGGKQERSFCVRWVVSGLSPLCRGLSNRPLWFL